MDDFSSPSDPITERYGVDPGTAFGINGAMQPAVEYGREYVFDGGGDSGRGGGGDSRGTADSGDEYERDGLGNFRFNKDGSRRKKRGRKHGSHYGNNGSKSENVLKPHGIERILLSMHGMMAAFTNTPELALDPDEGKKLSEAIANVAQYYDFGMSPEQIAWAELAMIACPVYGSRIFVIWQRMKAEKASQARPTNVKPPSTVTPAPTPAPAPSGPIMRQADPFGNFNTEG